MFGAIKGFFGMPIRKVKHAAIVGFVVPGLMFVDSHFGLGLGEELVNTVGAGVAATVLIWLPIIQAYVTKSAPRDVENISR